MCRTDLKENGVSCLDEYFVDFLSVFSRYLNAVNRIILPWAVPKILPFRFKTMEIVWVI